MHRPLQVVTCRGREHIGARGLETLTFDLSNSKWSQGHPCHGFLPTNTPFRSRRRARHGNRLTDRENGYQRLMSPPYGAGGIRSLLMTIKITLGCQSLVTKLNLRTWIYMNADLPMSVLSRWLATWGLTCHSFNIRSHYRYYVVTDRVVFVGGAGELPPHRIWPSLALVCLKTWGEWKGGGEGKGKGKGGETPALLPPTGFCLIYHPWLQNILRDPDDEHKSSTILPTASWRISWTPDATRVRQVLDLVNTKGGWYTQKSLLSKVAFESKLFRGYGIFSEVSRFRKWLAK